MHSPEVPLGENPIEASGRVADIGAVAVIPSNRTRKVLIPPDTANYTATGSSVASIGSITFAASQHDTTAARFTPPVSSTSLQP